MPIEKSPDIVLLENEENEDIIAINVPKYYDSFMSNLRCIKTEKEGIWNVGKEYVEDVRDFLKTCNVNSGFVGYVKREWTESRRRRRSINKILSLVEKVDCGKYDELNDLDKLDVIVSILEKSVN